VLDAAMQEASLAQEDAAIGQGSLFGDASAGGSKPSAQLALPNVAAWPETERLTREKEILGFYISGHPLEPFRTECELFATHTVAQLGQWTPEPIALGCVVTSIRRQISKRSGAEFARLTVEDFSGSSEVLVFPEAWSVLADQIRPDVPILLKGGYSRRDQGVESPTFIVEGAQRFAELRTNGQVVVTLDLAGARGIPASAFEDVRAVADAHPGTAPLEVRWADESGTRARFRSRSLTLAASNAALTELRALLGQERVKLVRGS